jgi:hypothetical protein
MGHITLFNSLPASKAIDTKIRALPAYELSEPKLEMTQKSYVYFSYICVLISGTNVNIQLVSIIYNDVFKITSSVV